MGVQLSPDYFVGRSGTIKQLLPDMILALVTVEVKVS
jgi:hypothetical protein